MTAQNEFINDTYNRLAVIIKNDVKHTYAKVGSKIVACTTAIGGIESYFEMYPPLLDISELGASLEYEGSTHKDELIKQIKYKMQQLKEMLPDIR